MDTISIDQLIRERLIDAADDPAHRSSETVFGGSDHVLRQTVITMKGGTALSEHESPGDATVFVLRGRVRLVAGPDTADVSAGEMVVVPGARHSLEALDDSALLLTVAKTGAAQS